MEVGAVRLEADAGIHDIPACQPRPIHWFNLAGDTGSGVVTPTRSNPAAVKAVIMAEVVIASRRIAMEVCSGAVAESRISCEKGIAFGEADT